MAVDATLLKSMEWRCIGPPRGGRVIAAAGHPTEPMVFYFGACAGGVWKTDDGGTYWHNISDGFFNSASVGAIAISESDPNVIYVGTGEACIRGNLAQGDGVYKSTDGGKTWAHKGLTDTKQISRVRIHPDNPDLVYVAALGHAFGPNGERGVFRSKDGGDSWEKVLYRSDEAGACDLSIDATNPRVLYAAFWQAQRGPWSFSSGGPGSGLFKSTDAGDTWTEITENPGMPKGLKGRIGVAASPARKDRVWAIMEVEDWAGGLFRSDDGGANWERVSDDRNLQQRPWYYTHVYADPRDEDTVYVLNMKMWKSTDGGRTFAHISTPHGDNHELWIDPRDPRRMIEGNDGGACVTFNGGDSWSTIYNQLTSQFYHLTTDDQSPYRVYGTQQDNSAISVPSRSYKGAIEWLECYPVGSSESGHIVVKPGDSNIVYSGAIGSSFGGGDSLLRYDHSTGQTKIVSVWPEYYYGWGAEDHKYRFQWTYPILFSPHDPKALYVAGNVVFRSLDEGHSWEEISPDLTRADVSKMKTSGGPITKDTTFVENYGTIFAFTESPHESGVFWAGSDDGLVHISRNGGETWDDVTPADIPEWTRFDIIEVSPHDAASAYVSATRYKFDDNRPYLYKTNDYGKTWTKITDGIPEDDFTRVIRADPERQGLLYAGTESRAYVSFDDGASWQSLRNNLPPVPVTDLAVKGNELVAATNGRSFWILDDLAVLRQIEPQISDGMVHLFAPAHTNRSAARMSAGREPGPGKNYTLGLGAVATYYEKEDEYGVMRRTLLDAGSNPRDGVVVTYFLKEKPEGDVTLEFLDSEGEHIKTFTPKPAEEKEKPAWGMPKDPYLPVKAGANLFVWNMRYPNARQAEVEGASEKGLKGPLGPPGQYQVRLTVGGRSQTQSFDLVKDPGVPATQEDLEAQFDLLIRVRDKLSETHDAVNRIISVRAQVDQWVGRTKGTSAADAMSERADGLKEKLTAIERELINRKAPGDTDSINLPNMLNSKIAELTFAPSSADSVPTKQSYDVFASLSERADAQFARLQDVIDNDLEQFIELVHEMEVPPIVVQTSQ